MDRDFQRWWWPCFGVPSLSSSPTPIMTDWSSRGCISCWVQRASLPRSWPVFVLSAPLHSQALCDSVRPGCVIKKARAQVVIIRGLSTMGCRKKKRPYLPLFCRFVHCLNIHSESEMLSKCKPPTPANTANKQTVNTHIHAWDLFFLPS